uniref:Uncharacterized protein n=1 Tax=Ditylenchus dipsaci TaxID=166011 RepID=A0A915CUP9_9BILA
MKLGFSLARQEQILQKEHAIQEYKALVEGLQTKTGEDSYFKDAVQQQLSGDASRLRTSAEIINNLQLEEKERRIVGLEHQIKLLEEANAELGEQLNSQAADQTTQMVLKHVGIQTIVTESIPRQEPPVGNAQNENDSNQHQQYDEEEASGIDDSGTVEDIEDRRSKKNSSLSNSTGSMDRQSSGDTHTLRPATSTGLTAASAGVVEPETLLLRHRNETRRLRLKIVALDKRNRQLMDENVAYRERTKFSSARKPLDPNSEAALMKKEMIDFCKGELDSLEKRLKKSDASVQSKISSELWEERKRHSQAISTLKQRISQLETEEKELNGRILRRDKLIEQLNKDNSSRYVDADRLNTLLKEWRQERALLEKKERELRTELEVSAERYKSVNHRLEMLAKENKNLQIRVARLQERLSQSEAEKSAAPAVRHKEVQTPDEFNFRFNELSKSRLGVETVRNQILHN